MKRLLIVAVATLAIQAPVHALFGIGVSGGYNRTSIDAKQDLISGGDLSGYFPRTGVGTPSLSLSRAKMSDMMQVGAKVWLELPLLPIEFEASSNLAWGNYKSTLAFFDGTKSTVIPVDVESPLALGADKGSTPYVSLFTDVTVRYPIVEFPPVLHTLKIYVGAGATQVMATRVIDRKDLQETFSSSDGLFDAANPAASKKLVQDNLLQSTLGGHVSVGAQVKVPILPFAFFIDGKWYFHTAVSDAASQYPIVLSAGVGFAL